MEDDVVLADKVDQFRRRPVLVGLPVAAPPLRVALGRGPLFGDREVADGRVEPDVENFPVRVLPDRSRDGDAPVEVAGDATVL